jgi:hypothetical protein
MAGFDDFSSDITTIPMSQITLQFVTLPRIHEAHIISILDKSKFHSCSATIERQQLL